MKRLRRWWPDLLVVVGVAWLSYACSAYAGDGSLEGQIDPDDGGDVSGDVSIGYTDAERLNIVGAATVTALGVLAKVNRRDSGRDAPPPVL